MPWQECQKLAAEAITTQRAIAEAIDAAKNIHEAFKNQCPEDWLSLGPRGQVALMNLFESVNCIDLDNLATEDYDLGTTVLALLSRIEEVYRTVGAPGDWGYDHPTGDAARWLYDTIRLLSWHVAGIEQRRRTTKEQASPACREA